MLRLPILMVRHRLLSALEHLFYYYSSYFDHTSLVYVMGPDGTYRTHFAHTTDANVMAERLAKLL